MERRIIEISGKKFIFPEEITFRQYNHAVELITSIVGGVGDTLEKTGNILSGVSMWLPIIMAITKSGALGKLMAILLVPEGEEKWRKEFIEQYADIMEDMGDKTAIEVLQDFFVGRTDLISSMGSYLENLAKSKKKMSENMSDLSQDSEKEKEA